MGDDLNVSIDFHQRIFTPLIDFLICFRNKSLQ